MKQIIPIILMLLIYSATTAQNQTVDEFLKDLVKKTKVKVRLSNDPFYQRGDTLYLIYDQTDSLQKKELSGRIRWYWRPLTPKEKEDSKKYGESSLFSYIKFSIHPRYKKKVILPPDSVKNMTLATRKEFIDFYNREYKRTQEEYKITKDRTYVIALGEWPLQFYFEKIFMIEPLEDGKFVMYRVL